VIQVQVLHSKIQVDKAIQFAAGAAAQVSPAKTSRRQQIAILLNRLQPPAPVPDLHSPVEDELADTLSGKI
jgi:hypothetical protein